MLMPILAANLVPFLLSLVSLALSVALGASVATLAPLVSFLLFVPVACVALWATRGRHASARERPLLLIGLNAWGIVNILLFLVLFLRTASIS